MKTWILSLIVLVLTVSLLSACSGLPSPAPVAASADPEEEMPLHSVNAEGKLLPAAKAELSFAQTGVVAEVLVQPGDTVANGDVLARLVGIETAQAELAAAQLESTLAQQSLDTLRRGALLTGAEAHKALQDAQKAYENEARGWNLGSEEDATDLQLALNKYIQAEADYRKAKTELDRQASQGPDNPKRLDAQGTYDEEKANLHSRYASLMDAIPTADDRLDEKQTTLLNAISSLELARQQVERLDKGIDREQLAAGEARLKAAQARLAAADAALALYELRAPIAGTVLSVDHLSTGEAAIPGRSVIYLADTARWVVETKDLAEVDVAQLALGQKAEIQLDAFADKPFTGTVTAINPVGREYLGDMTYQITVTLDETNPQFLWNMTATVAVAVE